MCTSEGYGIQTNAKLYAQGLLISHTHAQAYTQLSHLQDIFIIHNEV